MGVSGREYESEPPLIASYARQVYDAGQHWVAEIAGLLGVARTTVYGHLTPATSPSKGDNPRAS